MCVCVCVCLCVCVLRTCICVTHFSNITFFIFLHKVIVLL